MLKKPKKLLEVAKAEITDANSPFLDNSRMPSHEEILAKAQQLYMKDNGKQGYQDLVGTNLPEFSELQEEGYVRRAQLALMTSEDTVASRKTMDYVGGLRTELEKIGFMVIPMEGFSVEDLKY